MRTVTLFLVLVVGSNARADSFTELAGGIAIPAGDQGWTDTVGTSPKLAVRVGSVNADGLGVLLAGDWTPENLNTKGGAFPGGSLDTSGHRFRVLAQGALHHRIAPKILFAARAGAGIDIIHGSYSLTVLGATSSHSTTDLGYALEVGAGVWFDVGSTQLGVELALPIGHHDEHAATGSGDISYVWTAYDVDLLFGVRL
jgi:hypothetical protein